MPFVSISITHLTYVQRPLSPRIMSAAIASTSTAPPPTPSADAGPSSTVKSENVAASPSAAAATPAKTGDANENDDDDDDPNALPSNATETIYIHNLNETVKLDSGSRPLPRLLASLTLPNLADRPQTNPPKPLQTLQTTPSNHRTSQYSHARTGVCELS